MNDTAVTVRDTKKVFWKLGTCSRTYFFLLNRQFGNNKEAEETAADPFAGGIMKLGYQCGMLWGSTLAVGAESFRRHEDRDHAVGRAITATQHVMESFINTTGSADCRDITGTDMTNWFKLIKYMIFKAKACWRLADKWAPKAIRAAVEGVALESVDLPPRPVSCASEVVRRMGGSAEEAVMVAGFAGGMGLSGNACGAAAAAVWFNTLDWCRKNPGKSAFPNPVADSTLKAFYKLTGDELLCHKICDRRFKTVAEHTEFIKNNGCEKLMNDLAQT